MPNGIGYEVDFLPVGNGERSGDAISIRFGTPENYQVLVYDGGTKESGQNLVDHIKKYYNTTHVDYVLNSHPDADHSSGLSVILEQLTVGQVWLHRPWNYSSIILDYFKDTRITDDSLAKRLKEEMSSAYELEQLALRKKIPIMEPFLGSSIGPFVVLSPEQDWYVHTLIPAFEKSPEQKELSLAKIAAKAIAETAKAAVTWIAEHWGIENLREDVETSAENESSVVLYGSFDNHGLLLTGDAGIQALNRTSELLESKNLSLPSLVEFIQVPHHGSRHNVSTSVLDRIVGPRKSTDDGNTSKSAFVSASKASTTHPRKSVVNAFLRRGTRVFATKGVTVHHHHNMPPRKDWVTATAIPFSTQVEPWE